MTYISLDDPEEFKQKIHRSLRAWLKQDSSPDELLADLFLVQLERRKVILQSNLAMLRRATNVVLEQAIDELREHDEGSANVLFSRFADNKTRQEVANSIHMSEHTVSRIQDRALDGVTAVLIAQERTARETHTQKIEARLAAPSYTKLFGRDAVEQQLFEALIAADTPWLVAIVGLGGIGKTALADKVVRQIIPTMRFEDVLWLHADSEPLYGRTDSPTLTFEQILIDLLKYIFPGEPVPPAVEGQLYKARNALKLSPHLVVIDNLESEEDIAFLMNKLYDLTHPSKFLLTTRTLASRRAHVVNIELGELSLAEAKQFVQYHGQEREITAVSEITDEDLQAIYALTGGNPLALKIVVSQLDTIPLPRLLRGINQSYSSEVDAMFKRVYWHTWRTLSPQAQTLLQAMDIVPDQADADYLMALSGLDEGQLWRAIEELRQRSLLDVHGDIQEKLFQIHPLTRSFLRSEIIKESE